MPKTHRDFMKRSMAQAVHHIEAAEVDLLGLKEQFDPVHPQHAEMLEQIMVILEQSIKFIADWCWHAWGTVPDNWDSWRNPTKREEVDDGPSGD